MRTFKKLSIWLILLVLLVQMSVPALAAATELRIVGPAEVPAVGEEFTVSVEISGNPGFNTFEAVLPYDTSKLECVKVTAGAVTKEMLLTTNANSQSLKGAAMMAASLDPQVGDGLLVTFRFRVLAVGASVPMSLSKMKIGNEDGAKIAADVSQVTLGGDSTAPDAQPAGGEESANETPEQQSDHGTDDSENAAPNEQQTAEFTDIANHWGKKEIIEAAELGLFKGYPDGRFDPDAKVTRAQFLTVLYRMAGSPAVTAEAPFTDIADQIPEFRKAIAWGFAKGYVNGKSETAFDPSGNVTRQEAMKILFGYSGGTSGMESMFTAIYDESFTDSDQIASWAKTGMYWGVYNDIISGTSKTTLTPQGPATRAQLAKMLVNYNSRINQIGG